MFKQPIFTEILKIFLTINSISSPYHAKYFMYYTVTLLPNLILFSLKSVFSISVENSVDPVASERNQLISVFKNGFNRTMVNSVFSRSRVNSTLTFKWGENLPVYLAIVWHLCLS